MPRQDHELTSVNCGKRSVKLHSKKSYHFSTWDIFNATCCFLWWLVNRSRSNLRLTCKPPQKNTCLACMRILMWGPVLKKEKKIKENMMKCINRCILHIICGAIKYKELFNWIHWCLMILSTGYLTTELFLKKKTENIFWTLSKKILIFDMNIFSCQDVVQSSLLFIEIKCCKWFFKIIITFHLLYLEKHKT